MTECALRTIRLNRDIAPSEKIKNDIFYKIYHIDELIKIWKLDHDLKKNNQMCVVLRIDSKDLNIRRSVYTKLHVSNSLTCIICLRLSLM